jgi:dimeric dUTPase (all-alpha-NTP-PPase superfamily)
MGEIDSDELTTMFFASKPRQPLYPDQIQKEAVEEYAMAFIKRLGLTANCLKNKPWKQSHMLTDVKKFRSCLNNAFLAFIDLCKVAGFNSTGLYNMYIRKNEVNKFRQGSGY